MYISFALFYCILHFNNLIIFTYIFFLFVLSSSNEYRQQSEFHKTHQNQEQNMRICLCVCLCAENDRKKDTDLLSIENDDDDAHNHIQYLPYCLQIENIFLKYFFRCFFLFTCSFSFINMMLAFCLSLLYQYNLYTLFENFVFVQDITRKNFTQPSSSTKSNCIFLSFSSCFLLFLSFNAISLFDIQFRIPKNSVIFCIRPIRIPSSCSLSLLHSRSFALPLSHTVSNVIFLFLSCFFLLLEFRVTFCVHIYTCYLLDFIYYFLLHLCYV